MQRPLPYLLAGLALSLGGLALYFRNRSSGKSADVIEKVEQRTIAALEPKLYAPKEQNWLEEIGESARGVAASIILPQAKTMSTSGSRGLRNNNPGNIRKSGDAWQGLAAQQTDPAFFQFTDAKYGVRALAKILLNYERKYGLRSVRELINRWAPPIENNTSSYVASVARALNVTADEALIVYNRLPDLAAAIIRHENGSNPYTADDIRAWVYLS